MVNSIFWGVGFILIGCVMLLNSLGVISVNVWDFWPLIFVWIGVSIIISALFGGKKSKE